MQNTQYISSKRFADLVLDIGTFLLASGAHCGRVSTNIRRLAETWGFNIHFQPTFKGLLVSVQNLNDKSDSITLFREAPSHSVHLQVLTEVSHLTWKVYEEKLSIEDTERAFGKIKSMPHYNCWMVSLAVGLSCAGLCLFSLGDYLNAIIAFMGAFIGSVFRYRIAQMNFNPMIPITLAAFATTLITGLGTIYNIGAYPEAAMATAVLYLIPGVPLINTVIDWIEGYLSSAVNRAMFAGLILLSIAVGMTLCITMLGIDNFSL
ncbi:MAG TPA: threonine/serine exporter [Dysgonomonas sp.]|nr:threonine/serine exporter [Dysgonomonas sp.]